MPQELPRVELEHPSDLDFIVDAVAKYAHAIAKQRVRTPSTLGVSSPLEETLRHAIERVSCYSQVGLCCAQTSGSKRAHKWIDV